MMPADGSEEAPDPLNEGLVAARLDGVVPEKADAVLTVGKEVNALPNRRSGGPVPAVNSFKGVVNCADLPSIIRGTGGTEPIRVRAVCNDWAPQGGRGVGRIGNKKNPSCGGRI